MGGLGGGGSIFLPGVRWPGGAQGGRDVPGRGDTGTAVCSWWGLLHRCPLGVPVLVWESRGCWVWLPSSPVHMSNRTWVAGEERGLLWVTSAVSSAGQWSMGWRLANALGEGQAG